MDKQRALRYKTPIIILALLALVFTVLSCITYFVYYHWEYNNCHGFYELTVSFPGVFDLLSFFIRIAPYVLLVIYLLKFHNEFKATVLVPVIFGLIAFEPLYYFVENLIYGYGIYFRDLIFDIPLIVAFALATINALKGFSKKAFLIIAIVVGLLVEFWSIIDLFQSIERYFEDELYLFLFTWSIGILGTIALYVSLLLFGLKNRIPAIISVSPEKEKKNAEKMTPEQSLRLLKEKLDLGMITEEEYKAQRTEIINNL
jgi:uncharacterized membrane protein